MVNLNKVGINVWIDEIVSCLKDTVTGELLDTVVFKVKTRKSLQQCNKKNGWHINWSKLPKEVEIFALALKDSGEIQGLVAVKNDVDSEAAFIHWACAAPHNNKHDFGKQKYSGVGGHLFAIAVEMSVKWGYEGVIFGFAANEELLKHYINVFHAEYIGVLAPYQFIIDEYYAKQLMEVYTYDWDNI